MAKEKKKKQSNIYFTIKLTNEPQVSAEEKVNQNLSEQGTGIYTFYNTYVYVPFTNKIKENDFKKVEEAIRNRNYKILDFHPLQYEDTKTNTQLYVCFNSMDSGIGKHSWIYMRVVDYIELIQSLEIQYNIALVLSNTNIIIPAVLWPELKLIHNEPIVTFKEKENQQILLEGDYQVVIIEDKINMELFQAVMSYRRGLNENNYNAIIQQLDETNTTVYMPIDLMMTDENIEAFKANLLDLNYTNTLSKTIFDSEMGKVCLVYTSKRYIPSELMDAYTWVSLNFMDAYRILKENKDWDYVLFNYLNHGFKANRNGLESLYEDTFALGNPCDLSQVDTFAIESVLEQFEDITEAYLYEAYNRIGNAILYKGNVEPQVLREKLYEVYPDHNIYANKLDEYEIHIKALPFYAK